VIRLTPVSYIVLALVDRAGEATPYALKGAAEAISDLWTVQHAQVYSEPQRLAKAGLLDEHREETGRRRRTYRVTDAGRKALAAWLAEPTREFTQLRDPGLLQLCLGAEPGPLARAQLALHERKLAEYEAARAASGDDAPRGAVLTLEAGIGHEREWIRFWRPLAEEAAD
jgi:DNA-binding PadR family transcriptional regulator